MTTPMREASGKVADEIIERLLSLPEEQREEVITSVRYNGIFCFECGTGDREHPNTHCQCWNDE